MIYLIDSNVYIHGFNNAEFGKMLRLFHQKHLPRLILSVVVAHELLVGAGDRTRERSVEGGLVEPFRTRKRLHVPARQTWEMAADIDRRLRKRRDLDSKLGTRSFFNDMLLAASARELGAVILTENANDFSIIGGVIDIQTTKPWPEELRRE